MRLMDRFKKKAAPIVLPLKNILFPELTEAVNKDIDNLPEPMKSQTIEKKRKALANGNAKCPDCSRIFGIWRLTAIVKNGVRYCHLCAGRH